MDPDPVRSGAAHRTHRCAQRLGERRDGARPGPATLLREAGADVVVREREGSHGDAFWQLELPLMVAWAFGA